MGSFSWTRADIATDRSNFTDDDMYKLLIPKEFGGGYITDIYWDYGYLFHINEENSHDDTEEPYYSLCGYTDGNGKFYSHKDFPVNDLYGILAYWNNNEYLEFEGDTAPKTIIEILKRGKTCDYNNRGAGIDVGCYTNQIDKLKFPLKMVSMSYTGTYEDCPAKSYGDPNQGFDKYYWNSEDYTELYEKLEELYRNYELKILENK